MAKSKKLHRNRPTCQRYKGDKRWETNKIKRAKRVAKQLNTGSREAKLKLRQQYPQLEHYNLDRWTLSALWRRVQRYRSKE